MSSVWSCCLRCCKEDREAERSDASERTRLLSDPGASAAAAAHHHHGGLLCAGQGGGGEAGGGAPSSSSAPMTDEQAAKRRIFEQGAADMIDVAGPYQIDQNEYRERMNEYSRRLLADSARPRNYAPAAAAPRLLPAASVLRDIPDPETHLAAPRLISPRDYRLVRGASLAFHDALVHIRVEYKENVVVPFEIPWSPA